MTKREKIHHFYNSMQNYGFSFEEADKLRRIEMTLHRWYEAECNGEIERNETTDKPEHVFFSNNKRHAYSVPDWEKGAGKRLKAIMDNHPDLWYYIQTDPRGCSLYIGRKDKLHPNDKLDCVYSSRGFGVCY